MAPRERPVASSRRATVAPSYPWWAKTRRAPSRIRMRCASRWAWVRFGTTALYKTVQTFYFNGHVEKPFARRAPRRRARLDDRDPDDVRRAAMVRARDHGLRHEDELRPRGRDPARGALRRSQRLRGAAPRKPPDDAPRGSRARPADRARAAPAPGGRALVPPAPGARLHARAVLGAVLRGAADDRPRARRRRRRDRRAS